MNNDWRANNAERNDDASSTNYTAPVSDRYDFDIRCLSAAGQD